MERMESSRVIMRKDVTMVDANSALLPLYMYPLV